MKKTISILFIFGLLFSLGLASAQIDDPKGKASSPIYFLDLAFDNLRYSLATEENKFEVGLEIMDERLAEIQFSTDGDEIKMIERNRQRIINKLENADLNETQKEQMRERLRLHQMILKLNKADKSEEAKLGLDIAIDNSRRNFNQFIGGSQ